MPRFVWAFFCSIPCPTIISSVWSGSGPAIAIPCQRIRYHSRRAMIRPIDLTDDDLWSLFNACCTGDTDTARTLIERRPELVNREYNYTAPLHFAVREGHLPVVRLLLERGANPI